MYNELNLNAKNTVWTQAHTAAKDSLEFFNDMMEQKMNKTKDTTNTKISPKFSIGDKVIIGSHPSNNTNYYSGRCAIISHLTVGRYQGTTQYCYQLKPIEPEYFPDDTLYASEELLTAYTDTSPKVSIATLLDVLHESVELSSANELKDAIKLIIEVQAMNSGMRDCIRASFLNGPLDDGDVPSKVGRNELLTSGYMSKIVVNGEEGYNALTYKGARAYRLIKAGA